MNYNLEAEYYATQIHFLFKTKNLVLNKINTINKITINKNYINKNNH